MLIIPYQTRFTARSLPVVTLALILVNALVYFVFQSGDRQAMQKAAQYYFSSELPSIELPRYAAALEQRGDPRAARVLRAVAPQAGPREARGIVAAMQQDREFMRDLRSGSIVPPGDPVHDAWRQQRDRFEALLNEGFTGRYALEPGHSWPGLLTHQFLHADAMHWFGNMLVLLLAGPFAEAALGRGRFLLAYLFSGACAGALFQWANGQALVGASGAIAGAMAMVAVLYGVRKVPVFYWLFVYFNTARVPALLLLPVWLAVEAVQWLLTPGSRVAYSAHIGGFLAGALAAWLLKAPDESSVDQVLEDEFADERRADRRAALLQEAQQAAGRLDTARAARAYAELLSEDPGNPTYATGYFNTALLSHDGALLADASAQVLALRDRAARLPLRPAYRKMSEPAVLAALPIEDQLRLVRRLVALREDAAALQVIDALVGSDGDRGRHGNAIAQCLASVSRTYARHGLEAEGRQIEERLASHFPAAAASEGGSDAEPSWRATASGSAVDIDLDSRLQARV